MLNIFKRSIHHRLLGAFLLIALVPYLFTMYSFSIWERSSILKEEHIRYQLEAEEATELIDIYLSRFNREMLFLSTLEIFDDLITGDVDRRISRLLEQRSKLDEDNIIHLHAIDKEAKIIASSEIEMFHKRYKVADAQIEIINRTLIIRHPLKASFDNQKLGYLIAEYPLENIKYFFENKKNAAYAIALKDTLLYGEDLESKTYFVNFKGILEEYKLFYSIEYSRVSTFFNEFLSYLVFALLLGILLIYFVARRLTRQITEPIIALTKSAEEIVSTQDFALRVPYTSPDEIGSFALQFNALVQTASDALETLSLENKMRIQRFINLTDMFNAISKIDNKEKCIDVSIEKLRTLVAYDIYFLPLKKELLSESLAIELYSYNILTHKNTLYGYLVIEKKCFDDAQEQRFFQSVALMIMSQIDRISLIQKLKDVSEAKSTFISSMSHELRTPLSAIIGFSQYLIMYETLNDEQIDTVAKIEKSALHLLSMINDILDISKIEAGKMNVKLEDSSLSTLLEESLELVSPLGEEKGLFFHLDIARVKDFVFSTDKKLLKQIIINLLSNAVKYSNAGNITLLASVDNKQLVISIIDEGIGIKKEDLDTLFEAFVQLEDSREISQKGTGLGLSLSRHLAQAIGAKLTLSSEGVGLGTLAILEFNL